MKKYCCKEMEHNLTFSCEVHANEFECPDVLITYSQKFDEYGIIIHDGGESSININFCPWCSIKLPESKRDLWFDTLEKMGFDTPLEQNIPIEFQSNRWYNNI